MSYKKIILRVLSIIVVLIVFVLVYLFPIQRYYSDNKFERYLISHSISPQEIENKKATLDYKNGGYVYEVRFKDDPDWVYAYVLPARDLKELKNGEVYCEIYCYKNNKLIQYEYSTKNDLQKNNLSDPLYK